MIAGHKWSVALLALSLGACMSVSVGEPAPEAESTAPGLSVVGDTVVYRERTNAHSRIERQPGDTVELRARHDAVINVTRWAPDTLLAWYEILFMNVQAPGVDTNVNTRPVLYRPFVLHLTDDWKLEAVRTPEQPTEVGRVTDLRRQFDDFFVYVPVDNRVPGSSWTDSAYHELSGEGGRSWSSAASSYRVTGDTMVHSLPALVVEYDSRIVNGTESGDVVTSELRGTESGSFIFAPARELMVERIREGELSGYVRVGGPTGEASGQLPQQYEYSSRIELLLPPDEENVEPAPPTERPT